MSKRQRNTIVLVVVLALLAGVYLYVVNRPKTSEDNADTRIEILKFDKDTIVKVVLESEDGTLTLEKVDDEWTVDHSRPVKLRKVAVDDILYSFASLYAERIVEENPEDLSVYGLDKPAVTATAYLEDGSAKVLYLGNKTPAGNTYYLMAEGDPKVYTVWKNHGEHAHNKLSDIREKELVEIKTDELTYLKIEGKDIRTIEIQENKEQTEEEAYFFVGAWRMIQPYNLPRGVSTAFLDKVLQGIAGLAVDAIVDNEPTDLSIYGLDEPKYELIAKDKENTLHLFFGDETEDGKKVYFKTADDDTVYTMTKGKTEFLETKPFEIAEKSAYIVSIDNVDKIIIEAPGRTNVITLTRRTQKAEDEDEEDEVITTYRVDGKEVEEKPFKKYYQSLIGLLVDAELDRELEEQPEVKTTFFLNKGSVREVHVNYVPYDNDFYAVFVNGKSEFVISRRQVAGMLDTLEALISGDLAKED